MDFPTGLAMGKLSPTRKLPGRIKFNSKKCPTLYSPPLSNCYHQSRNVLFCHFWSISHILNCYWNISFFSGSRFACREGCKYYGLELRNDCFITDNFIFSAYWLIDNKMAWNLIGSTGVANTKFKNRHGSGSSGDGCSDGICGGLVSCRTADFLDSTLRTLH